MTFDVVPYPNEPFNYVILIVVIVILVVLGVGFLTWLILHYRKKDKK